MSSLDYYLYFYKYKILLLFGVIIFIFGFFFLFFTDDNISVYTDTKNKNFAISDLNTESGKLYIDIKGKGYKAIEFTIKTDIDIKENKKINTFFGGINNLLIGFNSDKKNGEFNFYRLCNDDKCEQNYNISLFTEIKNKFIDKYLFPAPNEYTNIEETIAMNTAIRQSCYGNDKKYPKMDLCEILNIEPIFKTITINIIYHLKNGKIKTKTLIFNS